METAMTRQEFLRFMAVLIGSLSITSNAAQAAGPKDRLEQLIGVRDDLRELWETAGAPGAENMEWETLYFAMMQVNRVIMKRCPHDPATYIRQEGEFIPGHIGEHSGTWIPGRWDMDTITCPACEAVTYDSNFDKPPPS